MLVEFASASTRCAARSRCSARWRASNVDVPADKRIEFRIGIHVGDIIIDDNDIFGDGVNIAARLEGIAEPGGICISDDAHRQIRGKTEIAYDDMGEQSLKNIAEPMRAWRARPASSAAPAAVVVDRPKPAPRAGAARQAIDRVLPFQNMSGDPEQDYFADGMVEDIITGLSRIKWLFVIARNSSFTYKGRAVDVRQVGRELGVRYVLEGGVRKAGNRVRITAQLVEAETAQASVGGPVRRRAGGRVRPAGPDHRTRGRHRRAKPAEVRDRTVAGASRPRISTPMTSICARFRTWRR